MWNGCARWSDISKRIAICAFCIRTDAKIAILFLSHSKYCKNAWVDALYLQQKMYLSKK